VNDFLQELARLRSQGGYDEHWRKIKTGPRKRVSEQPRLRKAPRSKKCALCGKEFLPGLLKTKRDKFRRSDRQCCSKGCSKALKQLRSPLIYKRHFEPRSANC
jgi:hypothetical protein